MVDQLETDYVMIKTEAIYDVANSIKQLHIQKDVHVIYKQGLYKTKQKEIDDLFLEQIVPVMEDIEHPELIK